jgi:hypothetical protein
MMKEIIVTQSPVPLSDAVQQGGLTSGVQEKYNTKVINSCSKASGIPYSQV